MDDSPRWTCPTCHTAVTTPFCARCGEEPLPPMALTLRGVAEKVLHAFTSIDARTLRTLWLLLRQPGALTLAWTSGVRKPYVAPFQLFLIANVAFFTVQWLTGENVFSSSLDSHLHHQDWRELAQSLLAQRLEVTHRTIEEFAPIFDRAVILNAKSLILLMTVPFALVLPLVFLAGRRPFVTHLSFSLHLYAFLMLLFCVALLAGKLSALLGWGGLDEPWVDNVLSVANLMACAAFLYVAIGRVYDATGGVRIAKAALLAMVVAAIALGYRFILFLITLYAT